MTQQQKVIGFLAANDEMQHLTEIYVAAGAETPGQEAGVRGLLNRNTDDGKHHYRRIRRGCGVYTVTAYTRRAWRHLR